MCVCGRRLSAQFFGSKSLPLGYHRVALPLSFAFAMPVPNSTPARVVDALAQAERELKTATESLCLLSEKLSSVRNLIQDGESDLARATQEQERLVQPEIAKMTKASSPTSPSSQDSIAEMPPGLLLHRQQKLQRNGPMGPPACLRRMDTLGSSGSGQELALQGRWMELARQACQDTNSVREMAVQALSSSRSRKQNVDEEIRSHRTGVWHPRGTFKLGWDLIALTLLLNDCILLPVAVAWDFSMTTTSPGGLYSTISFYIGLVFWTLDLPINLNTAIYIRGSLVMNRWSIFRHYAWSWMFFDVSLLVLDYCFLFLSAQFMGLRAARIMRIVRLVRISKLSKLNTMIEESAASVGREWVTMVFAIGKTAVMMLMVAHFLTCAWFFVGVQFGPELPDQSWVELASIAKRKDSTDGLGELDHVQHLVPTAVQYIQSLRWVIAAPSPPDLSPTSGIEWGFDIFIMVMTLVVIGSAISKISGTTAELRAMREESNRRRHNMRLYLARTSVSYELMTRIMRFVDYKLEKFPSNTLDASLVSPTLQLELFVSQHADYLSRIPIFALTQECYPEIFSTLCAAMKKNFFEKGDDIFVAGAFATNLHVTATGTYSYVDQTGKAQPLKGTYWYGELSLFAEATYHLSTLTATSFAETFSLQAFDIVECVKASRGCTAMFCEYAKDFVTAMQKTDLKHDDDDQVQQGQVCCKQNQHFRAMYPDLKKRFSNIIVHGETADPMTQMFSHEDIDNDSLVRKASLASMTLCRLNSDNSTTFTAGSSNGSTISLIRTESTEDPGLLGFVMMTTPESLVPDSLPAQLEEYIPELHPDYSPHIVFEQAAERDRALSSCISILALVNNRYDMFTAPQGKNVKLTSSQWDELQGLIAWIEPSPQEVQAVLVLLAIRALGKSKLVQEQLPAASQRPERAVVHLLHNVQNIVPSVRWLNARSMNWVEEALITHELFNLAQMLQGENCPASVKQLREHVAVKGDAIFRFYILFLLGFMSGLAAGNGSRFMNAKNGESTIAGIRMLEHLMKVEPTNLYWGYMRIRAVKLQLPFNTPEDMVLLRLACLSRLQDNSQYINLKNAWFGLGVREREILTDHFLADGIQEPGWVLEFLPNCVANAQANKVVGLTGLLDVLADLMCNLRSRKMPEDSQMMLVDLSDMAGFISAVRNRFIFLTCIARAQMRVENSRIRVEMSGGNWSRTTEPDTDLTNIAYTLQDLVQKQQFVEERVLLGLGK